MANLLSQNIGTNYKGILNLGSTINTALSGTLQAITDGDGVASPLQLSTGEVGISRTVALSAGATNPRLFNEVYTINNSGAQTGTLTGIFLNATETALNGITHNLMDLQLAGVSRFKVLNDGGLTTATTITSGAKVVCASNFSFQVSGRSQLFSGADGLFLMFNNTGTGFDRLQFGGTTSSFPSIKRNGAAIDFRLADDSGFCAVNSGVLSIQNTVAAAVAVASTHKVTVVIGGVTYYLLASNV